MKIKNFPLQMTEDFHKKAKEKAKQDRKPLYQWILDLIIREIEK